MHFSLVDRIVESSPDHAITLKAVSAAEEYLQDHFPTFPVLPGVMMLEAIVQAGALVAAARHGEGPWVLGQVRALKYGRFVKPGSVLRVQVTAAAPPTTDTSHDQQTVDAKGEARLMEPQPDGSLLDAGVACSGRILLRRPRIQTYG